ncbi:MAG: hypothetical protein ACE5EN_01360 [Nitrospinota bacterium]
MRFFVVIWVLISFTGCATMFHGSTDSITVRSEEDNTKLFVNEAYIGKNSGTTTIPKKGEVIIRAEKEGCNDQTAPVKREFDSTSLLGILIDFGIVSMLIIDGLATGAITQASQTNFVVTPDC